MPNEGLTGIIEAAVADAHDAGVVEDAPVVDDGAADADADAGDGDTVVADATDADTDTDTDADADPATVVDGADAGAKEPAKEAAKEPVKELSEVEKILAEAGITPPKPGQKDNKIPYSRTVKIIGNALKKQTDAHTTRVTAVEARATSLETRVKSYENADRLADADPDRYMQVLATINPAYKKFLPGGAAGTEKPAAAAAVSTAQAPGPDVKFEDGSFGYSPEQAQKREEWLIGQAADQGYQRAKADFEKQFGPIKEKWDAEAATAARLPGIRTRIAKAKETWGDRFPADGTPEQIAVSALVDQGVPFESALSQVLVPKVQETREQMRAQLLKELEKRPAAAVKKVPASVKPVPGGDGGRRDTEDVIREAIAAAGAR